VHRLVPDFILHEYAAGRTHGAFPAVGLFADISGFSTMTDVLMAHGQHGAEVLAAVMRAAFDPLIHSVYAHGGFVVLQAGDSFTALFPLGDEAPTGRQVARFGDADAAGGARRALAAASAIQQHAAAHPHHATAYGEFTISVKAGLAVGEAAWGIVTDDDARSPDPRGGRAAYYVQGTAVDGCSAAEHHAGPGDVIVTDELCALLAGAVTGEARDGHRRVTRWPDDLPPAQAITLPEVDLELAARFLPRELFTRSQPGEFRQVTHLFVSLPTIRTVAQLDIFMKTVFALQDRYGGLLKLLFGDKGAHLLVLWGAPVAYENDVQRALDFIVELQQHTALPVNGGVTHRVAHTGFVGSDLAEEYAAFGRGVNLAARFMVAAPRGEIWLDEHVALKASARYTVEFTGARSFKGFAEPQPVYSLLERKEPVDAFYAKALVGRESELQALRDFASPIFAGRYAGILVVWGEPGMGKSHLVHEFLGRWRDSAPAPFQIFRAQSDEILRESLNPFRYWLRHYCGQSAEQSDARNKRAFNRAVEDLLAVTPDRRLADELERTRSFLGALVGLSWPDSLYEQFDAHGRYETSFAGLIALLQAESLRRPVIFFLEDAHWLDDDSKAFIPRLLRALAAGADRPYPVALLVTARFEGAGLPLDTFAYRHIDLARLSRDGLAALAASQLNEPAAPALLDLLEQRAEGNPFFAEQFLQYLQAEGRLQRTAGAWRLTAAGEVALPGDVQAVLVARLDRLAHDVRLVVQTAAVLGREFEVRLLAHMLRDDAALPDKIAHAEREAIWAALNELRYIFNHALLRDAAYDMQAQARRRELHALAAAALESVYAAELDAHYGELAYHCARGGDDARAYDFYLKAGEHALAAYANSESERHFRAALALVPDAAGQAHSLSRLGEALFGQSRFEDALLVWRDSIRLCQTLGDVASIARLYARSARAAYWANDAVRSLALGREGLAAVAGQPASRGQADLLLATAIACYSHGLMDERRALCTQALAIAEQLDLADVRADALCSLGTIYVVDHRHDEALAAYQQSIALAEAAGALTVLARAHNNLGAFMYDIRGDFRAGREQMQRSAEICRRTGSAPQELWALTNVAQACFWLGELDAVEAMLPVMRRLLWTIAEPARGEARIRDQEISLLEYRGELAPAIARVRDELATARERQDLDSLRNFLNRLCALLWKAGQWAEAESVCVEAVQRREGVSLAVHSLCFLSMAIARQGRAADARRRLDEARAAAADRPDFWERLHLLWSEAEVARAEQDWNAALSAYEQRDALYRRSEMRWDIAYNRLEQAETHLARARFREAGAAPGDRARARDCLHESLALFTAMQIPQYADEVRRKLAALDAGD
jgi:class 3 adenylate cyclase/tetratricopeptide (TPR) repeat protein